MKKFEYFDIVRAKRKDMGSDEWPYIIRNRDDKKTIGHIKPNIDSIKGYSCVIVDKYFYFDPQSFLDIASFMEELG